MEARLRRHLNRLRYVLADRGIGVTRNERRLIGLKNACADKRGFILGNGPSLLQCDLDKLVGEVTIASNGIFLLFERTAFRPTYYTIEDVLVAEDRAEEVRQQRGYTKVFPQDLQQWLPPDDDTIYVNFVRHYRGVPAFHPRFAERVNFGGTVTFLNLQLAHYLGLREVYLIGFDHSYAPPKEADSQEGNVILSNTEDVNHFDPNYFGPGYRWHDPKVERMEEAYRQARAFFEEKGAAIYNATPGGQLEVFPRVAYEDLF